MSGRLLASIVFRHLRGPLRHEQECAERCAAGCGVRELDEALGAPVLPSEVAQAKREEQRFIALSRGEFPD